MEQPAEEQPTEIEAGAGNITEGQTTEGGAEAGSTTKPEGQAAETRAKAAGTTEEHSS